MNISSEEKFVTQVGLTLQSKVSWGDDIGLIDGKMGACINLFEISKILDEAALFQSANSMLTELVSTFQNQKINPGFMNGLAGLGWGIEYLAQNNYIEAETDEVLCEVDRELSFCNVYESDMKANPLDGFLGMGFYFVKRLECPTASDENIPTLVTKMDTISIIEKIHLLKGSLEQICKEPLLFTDTWILTEILLFLKEVYKLNIFNTRVKLHIQDFINKIYECIPKKDSARLRLFLPLIGIQSIGMGTNFCDDFIVKKNIERTALFREMEDMEEEHKLSFTLHILKLYYQISKLHKSSEMRKELLFWKDFFTEKIPDDAGLLEEFTSSLVSKPVLGVMNGFNGFYHVLPALVSEG